MRSGARPEVRDDRNHVLPVHDTVAVDVLRAAVARAEVAENPKEIRLVHDAVTVHVPRAG